MRSYSCKKRHYANIILHFLMGQSKISRCSPVGKLNYSVPSPGGFPSELTPGKQISSINLNYIFELRRFSAGDTFHQTAAMYVTVVVTGYCSEKTLYWAMAMIMLLDITRVPARRSRCFVCFVFLLFFHKLKRVVHKNNSRKFYHIQNKKLPSALFLKHVLKFRFQWQRTI